MASHHLVETFNEALVDCEKRLKNVQQNNTKYLNSPLRAEESLEQCQKELNGDIQKDLEYRKNSQKVLKK